MARIRSASSSISGPGISDSISWRPPTRSRGSTASASTTIPIPPSHWVNCRHISIEWSTASMSVRIDAPVVVNPDIVSKYASTGRSSWGSPERR